MINILIKSTNQVVLKDMDNDGYTDLLYLDETGDGIVDKKIEFLGKVIMFDWDINALF